MISFILSALQGCYVGDPGLRAVGKYCKQLEDLNLRFCEGVSDDGIVGIAQGCGKSLKSLGIAACARVTDLALQVCQLFLSLTSPLLDTPHLNFLYFG